MKRISTSKYIAIILGLVIGAFTSITITSENVWADAWIGLTGGRRL